MKQLILRMLAPHREKIGWALIWLGLGSCAGTVATFLVMDEEEPGEKGPFDEAV